MLKRLLPLAIGLVIAFAATGARAGDVNQPPILGPTPQPVVAEPEPEPAGEPGLVELLNQLADAAADDVVALLLT